MPGERMQPVGRETTLYGLFVVTDDRTGLAVSVEPVRQGSGFRRRCRVIGGPSLERNTRIEERVVCQRGRLLESLFDTVEAS